ncbi:MAG: exonuclease domain-containing protein [Clostridiales bacterium]|nr:exonuclease domain-containing protein [Clostridiales bacterium]
MSYVILDLEWNGAYSKQAHKYISEIIEFGAVKVDDDFSIIDKFSMLVKPQIAKKLRNKISELTKITNEELNDEGLPFLQVVEQFTKFSGDSVLMTWGTSDILALIENYCYHTGNTKLPFLKRYCNIQEYCESCLGLNDDSAMLGLLPCAEKIGLEFSKEEHHRAFADAEMSLECMLHFTNVCSLSPFIVDADNDDFYGKLTFKNYFISSINSPYIDKKQLRFVCDECGNKAKKTSDWSFHNRFFTANFTCKSCGKKFLGKISFKKKYDSVVVKKKILPQSRQTESKNTAT